MGKSVQEILSQDSEFKKTFQLVWCGSLRSKNELKKLTLSEVEIVIDFSKPKGTLTWTRAFKNSSSPLPRALVCTTGFSPSESKELVKTFSKTPLALVPNTSLGIASTSRALQALAQSLDSNYKFSIFESHHIHKVDAPSGTALHLKKCIEDVSMHKVEMHSTRGGSDPGTHRVLILGPHEKIELIHRAEARKLFARGALVLAQKLSSLIAKPSKGPLNMKDLF